MVQNQLIDYISSQIKLGISKETIKASLVGAGWAVADIDETLKHMDSGGGKVENAPVATAASIAAAKPAMSPFSSPASGGMKNAGGGNTIRMSDLISTPDSATSFAGYPDAKLTAKPNAPAAPAPGTGAPSMATPQKPATPVASPNMNAAMAAAATGGMPDHGGKGMLVMKIVFGIVILALGGLAGFLYFENNSLSGKITLLTAESAKVTSDLAALKGNLATTSNAASSTMSAADMEIAALTATNAELSTNLSFLVAPPGTPAVPGTKVTVTGILSGGSKLAPYAITTKYGVKISVSNSKDPNVIAFFARRIGVMITASGTYTPGIPNMTVIPPPPAPATSTSTSTSSAPAASSTAK